MENVHMTGTIIPLVTSFDLQAIVRLIDYVLDRRADDQTRDTVDTIRLCEKGF